MAHAKVEGKTTPYEASYTLFHAIHGGPFHVSPTALFDERGMLETWLVPRSKPRFKSKSTSKSRQQSRSRSRKLEPQVLRRHSDKVNLLLLLSEWVEMQQTSAVDPVALVLSTQGTRILDQRSFKSHLLELGKHEARLRFDVYEASDNVFPGPMVMVSWTQSSNALVYVSELEVDDENVQVRVESSAHTVKQLFPSIPPPSAGDNGPEEELERSVATVLRNSVTELWSYLKSRRNMSVTSLKTWHWIDPLTSAPVLIGCSEFKWIQLDPSTTPTESPREPVSRARLAHEPNRHLSDLRSLMQTQSRARPYSARPSSAHGRRQRKQPFVPSSSFPSELIQKPKSLTADDEILARRDKQSLRKTKHLLFEERQLTATLRTEILTLKAATKQDEARILHSSAETSELVLENSALSKEVEALRRRDSQRTLDMKRLQECVNTLERSLEEEACELHDTKSALSVTKHELSDTREELLRTVSEYRSTTAATHQEKDRLVEKGMILKKQLADTLEELQEKRERMDQLDEFRRLCWTVLADANTPGVNLPRKGGKRRRKSKGKPKIEQQQAYPIPNAKNVQIVVKALMDDAGNRNQHHSNKAGVRKPVGAFGRLTRMSSRKYKVEDSST